MLPLPPDISDEDMQKCRETDDFCPVLFEWYKYVGSLCITFANLQRESPALRDVPVLEYTILVGLLTRCSRLMLSNVNLSHEGKFGETTAIIDRCIFESCVIISWLCRTKNDDRFKRYMAGGLKTEIEFKKHINNNISARDDQAHIIEERMLKSINRSITASGLSEPEITTISNMPDLASMLETTGRTRLEYVVGQRIGSHHVHGTFVSLLHHYLEENESGTLVPRDHNCYTHVNQYVSIPLIVLDALSAFVDFVFPEGAERDEINGVFEAVAEEIYKINNEVIGDDFTPA